MGAGRVWRRLLPPERPCRFCGALPLAPESSPCQNHSRRHPAFSARRGFLRAAAGQGMVVDGLFVIRGHLTNMTTIVTESNQVSIPPDIAREFDIHPGTRFEWAKAGEGVIT